VQGAGPQAPQKPEDIVTLGSTSNEVDAHLLADALRGAGIDARAMDAHAGGALPFSNLFPASILVRAGDYAGARELVERILAERQSARSYSRCPACTYTREGLRAETLCPECGTDLEALARLPRGFQFARPPGSGRVVRSLGAVVGLLALLAIGALAIALAVAG